MADKHHHFSMSSAELLLHVAYHLMKFHTDRIRVQKAIIYTAKIIVS